MIRLFESRALFRGTHDAWSVRKKTYDIHTFREHSAHIERRHCEVFWHERFLLEQSAAVSRLSHGG